MAENSMNRLAFIRMLEDTMTGGREVKPRGQLIREIRDLQITVDPLWPFQGFQARGYNLDYFKEEMRWKLGADPFDESIKKYAKMWESVQNPDGTFNSNYGQYWFGDQMGMMKVVLELIRDPDSRRATIPMLSDRHLSPGVRDTVCTEAVTFHIRDSMLYTSVHMRSSDQIFGLGTDIPTFSVLAMMVLGLLRAEMFGLELGTLTITAASSHIYGRHFKMVEAILAEDPADYQHIGLPTPATPGEVLAMVADRGRIRSKIPHLWSLYKTIYEGGSNVKA